jgi:hypothetical protein
MMHITDIWATFTALAGVNDTDVDRDVDRDADEGSFGTTDGIDMWSAIVGGGASPRNEIAHTGMGSTVRAVL